MTDTSHKPPAPFERGLTPCPDCAEREVLIYPRFERLWHWSQAGSIVILMFTGLGMNGWHNLLSFEMAVRLHTLVALALLLLWVFATFWLMTTGNWKVFLPRVFGLFAVARYYAFGVFKGEHHPYQKSLAQRLNPLQAMAYAALKTVVFPLVWGTGLVYLTYNFWETLPNAPFWLELVANVHLAVAWIVAGFVILHIYLLTIGHSFREGVRPMIVGTETVALTPEQEAYLERHETWRLVD
ncbi:cytochrome b/b6 domain-containing protein [Rhodovulum euryhalinum]|uniref:Thiosulfate reductase cytochrome b subunit n=1 Tax=Rhodovulum euryhalinum TaxID=35805 RepID=A0A4R2K8V6_9RHOB|nr:cytochrome b/b6 domain-containing protein [Rhodovulum euryhalinum]TCO69813.1 thiosulfate reductase cytochrome b subunit [Rhodovulum euryhalinum]